jgi:hypothetical protein
MKLNYNARKKVRYYYIAVAALMLNFFSRCFWGTPETVGYNVTTLSYGISRLPNVLFYFSSLLIYFTFIKNGSIKKLKAYKLLWAHLCFLMWIGIVPFLTDHNFLNNFSYSTYFIFVFTGIVTLTPELRLKYIKINISIFQLVGMLIMLFSIVFVLNNPNPIYRGYRASIMHLNANEDALILTVSLPFLFLIKHKYTRWIVIIYYWYFMIFYNSTRGAISMSAIIMVIMSYKIFGNRKILITLLLILFMVLYGNIIREKVLDDPIFRHGLSAITSEEKGNFTGRITGILIPLWNYTITHSPIYGFGSKSLDFISSLSTYYSKSGMLTARAAHNFFIVFLVNWGLVGLTLISYIYFNYFWQSRRIYTRQKSTLHTALLSAWIGFTGMNFVANSFSYRGWTILSLLLLTTHLIGNESKKDSGKKDNL